MITFDGMTFELVEITDDYVVTELFFDYAEMSDEDLSLFLEGDLGLFTYVSLEESVANLKDQGFELVSHTY